MLTIVPYILLMTVYLLGGCLVVRGSRFFADATSPASHTRFQTIDGLRGFLALGVFFHHCVITQNWYQSGRWFNPRGFYGQLGPASVYYFFMVTGFLFWSKAIHGERRIQPLRFYGNRLLRIAPMYLFVVLAILLVAAGLSGFELREPIARLLGNVARCLMLGMVAWPRVNGIDVGRINAYVVWTLAYEWGFYLSLPVLARWATPRGLFLIAAATILGVMALRLPAMFVFFLLGMTAAQIVSAGLWQALFRSWLWPALAIAVLAIPSAMKDQWRYSVPLLLVAFTAMTYDSKLFALFRWRTARYLGTISYSVYLLHGMVLFVGFRVLDKFVSVRSMSPTAFWLAAFGLGLCVILTASLTYRYVEYPFLGRKPLSFPVMPSGGGGQKRQP